MLSPVTVVVDAAVVVVVVAEAEFLLGMVDQKSATLHSAIVIFFFKICNKMGLHKIKELGSKPKTNLLYSIFFQ